MGLKDFFSLSRKPEDVLRTPYGNFNLAKESDRKRIQKMVLQLHRTTDALTRKDIQDWRSAWQLAINVDSPNRKTLYDIYRDAEIDLHLSGCIEQRKGFVLSRTFKLVDADGNENEEACHLLEQTWFKQLLKYSLDSIYWGHSLIELGDITTDGDGCPTFSEVKLIPRKHVIPEYGRVISDLGQDWTSGVDYRQPPFTDWLIEAGQPDDLGLLLKAATQTIPKKNMLSFWDTFGEIFGMPMRIAKTTSRDPNEQAKLLNMLSKAGTQLAMVAGMETEIEFVESGKGDAYNVYDKRIDRANSELSKLIIGQTMTIEDGSSLSQSETHLEVFENLVKSDRDMLRDIVNNQLLPRMVKHGFPVKGLRFEWDEAVDYTPEQQIAYETMIVDRYEVDPEYFAEKYSMPVGERRNAMPIANAEGESEEDEDTPKTPKRENIQKGKQRNHAHPFFD